MYSYSDIYKERHAPHSPKVQFNYNVKVTMRGFTIIACIISVLPMPVLCEGGGSNINAIFDAADITTIYSPLTTSLTSRTWVQQTKFRDTLYADADEKSAEYLVGLAKTYRETFAKINPDVYEADLDDANLLFRAAVLSLKPNAPAFVKQAVRDFAVWHDLVYKPKMGDTRSAEDKFLLFSIEGLLATADAGHKELQRLFRSYFNDAFKENSYLV